MLINRAAIILKATQPAVDWINEVDPVENNALTLEDVREDCLVYLVPEDIEALSHAREWAQDNAELLLEEFMYGWYPDESLWPEDIGPALFDTWFEVEFYSMIIDTLDEPIEKEDG